MVAAKLASLRDGQRQVGQLADVPTQTEAAEMLNVGERTVRRAREVIDDAVPELAHAVERAAKRRLADKYDSAQERGEVSGHGGIRSNLPEEKIASPAELGLSYKDVHEARQI